MDKKEFNQYEYINDYAKKNYKRFDTKLKEKEFNEIQEILKTNKWTKADYLRESLKWYKSQR